MSREWGSDIKDIGDKIAGLTVSKAVELGDYLEEVHKIKPAAGGGRWVTHRARSSVRKNGPAASRLL